MASQLIQYGRWNDIKVYPLFMTFSNKEEPKVQLSLELKLSVIGWVKWVISLSLLENKKWNNDQLFAVVREQLIQWSAGSPSCCLAPLWRGDGVQQPPATRGPHRVSHLPSLAWPALALTFKAAQYLMSYRAESNQFFYLLLIFINNLIWGPPVIISSLK